MPDSWDSLQGRLTALRELGQRVSEAMTHAAVELRDQGLDFAADLLQDMERFRVEFRALRDDVSARQGTSLRCSSLNELESALAQRALQSQALETLGRVAGLQHREQPAFAPLQRVRAECVSLQSELAANAGHEAIAALAAGRHPLALLMRLVLEGDRLPDEHWEALQDTVAASYGRDLATAVARGRVTAGTSFAV